MTSLSFQLTRRNVIQNIATLFSGSVIAQGVTALTLLLIARQLGAENYGQYTSCLVLSGLTAIVFSLGLDHWLLREGGRQPGRLGQVFGSIFTVKVLGGALWLVLISGLAPLLNQETFPTELLRLSALTILLDTLFATVLTAFKASLRNKITSGLEAGSDIAWLLGTLVLIGLGQSQAVNYILLRAAVLLASVLLALAVAWGSIGLSLDRGVLHKAVRESLPFASSDLLAWASMRMDLLIIGFALGKLAAGLYSPAVGLVNAAFLVPAAVYMVMVPVLSMLVSTNIRQAGITARRTVVTLLAVGAVMTLGFAAAAPLLVALLGESYQSSLGLLQILSLVLAFKSGSFGMAAVLVVYGHQARRTVIQAAAVLLNTALNLWIVNIYGIYGVAWVYVLTEALTLAGYAWLVRRYALKPQPEPSVGSE